MLRLGRGGKFFLFAVVSQIQPIVFFIMVIGVSHAYIFHTFFFSVSFLHNLPQGSKYRSHSLMGSIRIIVLVSDAIPDCSLQRIYKSQITEEKARELIAEALRKEVFYCTIASPYMFQQ
jgi:hypothetical protein